MNKQFYLILLSIIIISFYITNVNAGSWGTTKQTQCVNLSLVSDASACNITTFKYPNKNNAVENVVMNNNNGDFSYYFCNTSDTGNYEAKGFCDTTPWTNDLDVTPSGTQLEIGQAILYILSLCLAFIIFLIILYAAITIPFYNTRNGDGIVIAINKLKMIKVGAVAFAYAIFTFIVGLLDGICNNFLYVVSVGKFFDWLYWIMIGLAYPLIIICAGLGFVIFIYDWLLKKKLKRLRFKYR